jgi:hypothetical protein
MKLQLLLLIVFLFGYPLSPTARTGTRLGDELRERLGGTGDP